MIVTPLRPASLVVLLLTGFAASAQVHKCRDADGHLSYQDEPCPPGTSQPAPYIAPPPAYVPPPADAVPLAPLADDEANYAYAPPPPPLPELYRCTRYDGQESYVSSDPTPRVYQVPLWAVLPDMTSSGVGGMSTSRGSASPEALTAYTTVADTCRPMPRA